MAQLGQGWWRCYSLAMVWGLGSSREGETDYCFIKAPSDCTSVHGLGMKMPPGQWQKWETSWLLFREKIINIRISYHDRREDNSYFTATSVGQLVTTQQLRQRSYIPAWQAWVKKTYFHNTSRGNRYRNGSPRHRLNTGIADEMTSEYEQKQKLHLNKRSPLCSEIRWETDKAELYSNRIQKEISRLWKI